MTSRDSWPFRQRSLHRAFDDISQDKVVVDIPGDKDRGQLHGSFSLIREHDSSVLRSLGLCVIWINLAAVLQVACRRAPASAPEMTIEVERTRGLRAVSQGNCRKLLRVCMSQPSSRVNSDGIRFPNRKFKIQDPRAFDPRALRLGGAGVALPARPWLQDDNLARLHILEPVPAKVLKWLDSEPIDAERVLRVVDHKVRGAMLGDNAPVAWRKFDGGHALAKAGLCIGTMSRNECCYLRTITVRIDPNHARIIQDLGPLFHNAAEHRAGTCRKKERGKEC
jgi:hypothetical protein